MNPCVCACVCLPQSVAPSSRCSWSVAENSCSLTLAVGFWLLRISSVVVKICILAFTLLLLFPFLFIVEFFVVVIFVHLFQLIFADVSLITLHMLAFDSYKIFIEKGN